MQVHNGTRSLSKRIRGFPGVKFTGIIGSASCPSERAHEYKIRAHCQCREESEGRNDLKPACTMRS